MDRLSIASAALELLDEVGLEGLTVRGLANRLEVQSPALYWHFRSKHELFDEMADMLQRREGLTSPEPGEPWREWLLRHARERRALLLSHRDGARLVSATRAGPALMGQLEAGLGALVERGFTPVQALRALTSVSSYVIGFVLEEQGDRQRHADTGETPPERMAPEQRAALVAATPFLAAAIGEGGDPGGESAFEDGLRMLIDGIGGDLRRSQSETSQPSDPQ